MAPLSPSLASSDTVTPSVEDLLEDLQRKNPARADEIARMLVHFPAGFALAPVLYTRVPSATRASLESEYVFGVRQRFLKFLAETQAEGLKRLGICDHGIARMMRGLDAANAEGKRYDVNVDHIIERAGSGRLSDARRKDPQRREDDVETYPVNHYGNLMLMPEAVHEYKNRLNALQGMTNLRDGESCWLLMMVPVRDALNHGYVCPPQPADAIGALKSYAPSSPQRIGEVSTLAEQARELMFRLREETVAGDTLALLETLAARKRPVNNNRHGHLQVVGATPPKTEELDLLRHPFTVSDLAQGSKQSNNGLAQIFNAAMSHDPAARQRIDRDLRPRLAEIRKLLNSTYDHVVANISTRNYNDFGQFFRGRAMKRLVLSAAAFPLPESQALLADYRRIAREMRGGKPLKPIKKAA